MTNIKTQKRVRLHKKIRTQVKGTAARPRLCVFKSNKYIYAQVIDDIKAVTLAQASDIKLEDKITKTDRAIKVGQLIAEAAKKAGVDTVVFDRGGFKYGGRVKALADSARASGLNF